MPKKFDWDAGNSEKCGKHGVTLSDIEALFRGPVTVFDDPAHSLSEQRLKGIGQTLAGRRLLVVFTLRDQNGQQPLRPISARYMHKKEVQKYERQ